MTEYTIKELCDKAAEIIRNAYEAWRRGEIERWQYEDVRRNTLSDVAEQAELT